MTTPPKKPALMALLLLSVVAVLADTCRPVSELEELPRVALPGFTKGEVSLPVNVSGIQIINVFAPWCIPCMAEMPALEEISSEWQIPVTGVAWRSERGKVADFIAEHGLFFKLAAIDEDGTGLSTWGVAGVPETLVLLEGRLALRHRGPLTERILQDMIAPLVIGSGLQ